MSLTVREDCVARWYNHKTERDCTDESLCPRCLMVEDEKDNLKDYIKMGEV